MEKGAYLGVYLLLTAATTNSAAAAGLACTQDKLMNVTEYGAKISTASGQTYHVYPDEFVDTRKWRVGDKLSICPMETETDSMVRDYRLLDKDRKEVLFVSQPK